MKRLIFMLMLTAFTALNVGAQITMAPASSAGVSAPADSAIGNATTTYYYTPVNSLNASTNGKYVVNVTCRNTSGTCTWTGSLEGTIDGTNYFKMGGFYGTDGNNCDSLQVTSQAATTTKAYNIKSFPGVMKMYNGSTFLSQSCRVVRLRLKVTTPAAAQVSSIVAKCLIQL